MWGCYWGDDSFWKVQHLDLSRVTEGIITRDERFGYIELATIGYQSPCFSVAPAPSGRSAGRPPFITLERDGPRAEVTFAVEMNFDLKTGRNRRWQRLEEEVEDPVWSTRQSSAPGFGVSAPG